MPKAFPDEFRRDVVAVSRKGESTIVQIAKDFGISPAALHRWLKIADVQDGVIPGVTKEESTELREAKKTHPFAGAGGGGDAPGGCYLSRDISPK